MSDKLSLFRKRKLLIPVWILALALVVFCAALGAGGNAVSQTTNLSGPVSGGDSPFTCHISGNDIIAVLEEGYNTENLLSLEILIYERPLPVSDRIKAVPLGPGQKEIIFPQVATGMDQNIQLTFLAYFADGSVKTVWTGTIFIT
ncbi:MAG: hypothetical protein Q4Q04_02695 [Methanocorpusculum sp.]|nr:hypothetical protein [Methanocorpusculum sp.]